jgi:serine/threonine protein kinase
MLTGELPYRADNPMAVCMKHVTEPLRPPRKLNPTIPEEIEAVVVKLLAKDPADRYGSAAELLADLERVRDGLLPAPGVRAETRTQPREPQTAPRRVARPRRRRVSRNLTVAAVAMLALLGTVMLGLSQEGSGQGSLPRVQDTASDHIDPPSGTPAGTAGTGSASPASSPAASASPAASSLEDPLVPAIPPPDDTQPPGQSQYAGGGN